MMRISPWSVVAGGISWSVAAGASSNSFSLGERRGWKYTRRFVESLL